MICQLCQRNPISSELQALCQRSCCIVCATAIAEALPRLKTQPQRRQAICMRLQERGIRIAPSDRRIIELVEYGVTDEQISGACDMAKESIGTANLGYVLGILRNERMRPAKYVETPKIAEPAPEVKAREDWERLGFASQKDYEAWQFSYDCDKRKGRKITEAEHRHNWISEAV